MALRPKRVLIAGCGLAGSAIRHFLAEKGALSHFDLHFWESSLQLGGRFATEYAPTTSSLLDNGDRAFTDTGAQYLTRFTENFGSVFDRLEQDNILVRIPNAPKVIHGLNIDHHSMSHYVAPKGFESVVAHFLSSTNRDATTAHDTRKNIHLGRTLKALSIATSSASRRITARAVENNSQETFDAIVLTVPVPAVKSILVNSHCADDTGKSLLGAKTVNWGFPDSKEENRSRTDLPTVQDFFAGTASYSQRYAFSSFYRLSAASANVLNQRYAAIAGDAPTDRVNADSTWFLKYDFDDDMVRFVSIENFKRHLSQRQAATAADGMLKQFQEGEILALLLHSSIPFAIEKNATTKNQESQSQMEKNIEEAFLQKIHEKYFPFLTNADVCVKTKLHHWSLSQITKPVHKILSEGDHLVLALSSSDTQQTRAEVILAGDYFRGSNFENTLHSSKGVADRLIRDYVPTKEQDSLPSLLEPSFLLDMIPI